MTEHTTDPWLHAASPTEWLEQQAYYHKLDTAISAMGPVKALRLVGEVLKEHLKDSKTGEVNIENLRHTVGGWCSEEESWHERFGPYAAFEVEGWLEGKFPPDQATWERIVFFLEDEHGAGLNASRVDAIQDLYEWVKKSPILRVKEAIKGLQEASDAPSLRAFSRRVAGVDRQLCEASGNASISKENWQTILIDPGKMVESKLQYFTEIARHMAKEYALPKGQIDELQQASEWLKASRLSYDSNRGLHYSGFSRLLDEKCRYSPLKNYEIYERLQEAGSVKNMKKIAAGNFIKKHRKGDLPAMSKQYDYRKIIHILDESLEHGELPSLEIEYYQHRQDAYPLESLLSQMPTYGDKVRSIVQHYGVTMKHFVDDCNTQDGQEKTAPITYSSFMSYSNMRSNEKVKDHYILLPNEKQHHLIMRTIMQYEQKKIACMGRHGLGEDYVSWLDDAAINTLQIAWEKEKANHRHNNQMPEDNLLEAFKQKDHSHQLHNYFRDMGRKHARLTVVQALKQAAERLAVVTNQPISLSQAITEHSSGELAIQNVSTNYLSGSRSLNAVFWQSVNHWLDGYPETILDEAKIDRQSLQLAREILDEVWPHASKCRSIKPEADIMRRVEKQPDTRTSAPCEAERIPLEPSSAKQGVRGTS